MHSHMNIYEALEQYNIPYTRHNHPPVMNMAESAVHCAHIPGAASKNLFLRNEKGDQHYLLVVAGAKRADLKRIAKLTGEKKVSFASPERLAKYLGCTPGSVSLLGLVCDTARAVRVLIDKELWGSEILHYHPPGDNTATLEIKRDNLDRFIRELGYDIALVDL